MKFSNQKLIEVLKAILWPIAVIVAIVVLKSVNFSKINISWEDFIKLLNVVIWPVTILVGLLFFRKNLSSIMGSLGSLNVGPTGLAMTFQEKLFSAFQCDGINVVAGQPYQLPLKSAVSHSQNTEFLFQNHYILTFFIILSYLFYQIPSAENVVAGQTDQLPRQSAGCPLSAHAGAHLQLPGTAQRLARYILPSTRVSIG